MEREAEAGKLCEAEDAKDAEDAEDGKLRGVDDTETGAGEPERVLGSLRGPEKVTLGEELVGSTSLAVLLSAVADEGVAEVEWDAEAEEDAELFSIVNVGPLFPESPNTITSTQSVQNRVVKYSWVLTNKEIFPSGHIRCHYRN